MAQWDNGKAELGGGSLNYLLGVRLVSFLINHSIFHWSLTGMFGGAVGAATFFMVSRSV